MAFYVAKIWSAGQPSGFSDLYAPWWGAHEVLLHGRNPYTPTVAHQIQTVIYGAALTPDNYGDFSEFSGGFAYPLYTVFLLWPLIYMPFLAAKILLICVSVLLTALSIPLWFRAFHFRVPLLEGLTLTIFAFGSFPGMEAIRLQNLSLLAALVTLAIILLAGGYPLFAGIVLAIATFKPQFVVLLVPWLVVWTLSDWRRRQSFAWSFLVSMTLLIAASEFVLPGWIGNFFRIARAYTHYTYGHSLLDVWFTPRFGPFAAAALLLAVTALCWKYRNDPADSRQFLVVVAIMLAATIVVIPTLAPHAQLLLLPGYWCLYSVRRQLWQSGRWARLVLAALCLLLAWSWSAAAILTAAAILFSAETVSPLWKLPLFTSPVLPLAVLLGLCTLLKASDCATPSDSQLDSKPAANDLI